MVSQSAEIHPLYNLAQPQVDSSQDHRNLFSLHFLPPFLLLYSWLYSEIPSRSLNNDLEILETKLCIWIEFIFTSGYSVFPLKIISFLSHFLLLWILSHPDLWNKHIHYMWTIGLIDVSHQNDCIFKTVDIVNMIVCVLFNSICEYYLISLIALAW